MSSPDDAERTRQNAIYSLIPRGLGVYNRHKQIPPSPPPSPAITTASYLPLVDAVIMDGHEPAGDKPKAIPAGASKGRGAVLPGGGGVATEGQEGASPPARRPRKRVGGREEVWRGDAETTKGGLTKNDLFLKEAGIRRDGTPYFKVCSRRASEAARGGANLGGHLQTKTEQKGGSSSSRPSGVRRRRPREEGPDPRPRVHRE